MCSWQISAIWERDCTSITENGVTMYQHHLFGTNTTVYAQTWDIVDPYADMPNTLTYIFMESTDIHIDVTKVGIL